MSWYATTNITQMDGVNLSVINVCVVSFLLYPDEPLMSVVHHGRIIWQKLMH